MELTVRRKNTNTYEELNMAMEKTQIFKTSKGI